MTNNLTRDTHPRNINNKKLSLLGDPIAFSFIFKDTQIVYSTEQSFLIGVDLKTNKHYYKQFDKCFVTCLDFEENKGILIAGLSNNFVAMINPRKFKFDILRTFIEFSSHPILAIKFINEMQKIVLTNTANEIILAERASKKGYKKYKTRLITRMETDSTVIHDIKVISLPQSNSSVIAFISVDKMRLVWLRNDKKFKLRFITSKTYNDLTRLSSYYNQDDKLNEMSESIIDDQYFRPQSILNFGKKEKMVFDSISRQGMSFGINELKLILKKKNQNLMTNSGVCILERKYGFENEIYLNGESNAKEDQFYLILTFESTCKIREYSVSSEGEVSPKNKWNITLTSPPIWGCMMGKNSLFFLFDNFNVSMLLLNQLDKDKNLFDYGELSKIGKEQPPKRSSTNSKESKFRSREGSVLGFLC
jgi:hypothetical protein